MNQKISKVYHQDLETIEQSYWGNPSDDATPLTIKCHALRKKRLSDLTVEDLRLMIGQHISLEYLVPVALDTLEENPLAEGDFYEGDLLLNVLKIESSYWEEHKEYKMLLDKVMSKAKSQLATADIMRTVIDAIKHY